MFFEIANEYKKLNKSWKFNKYYWGGALIIFILLNIIFRIFENPNITIFYTFYISFFVYIFIYLCIDFIITIKKLKINCKKSLLNLLYLYIKENTKSPIDDLAMILANHNFKTRTDLKLAIDFYNEQRPFKAEADFIAWIISITAAIASLVQMAYDKDSKIIDLSKLLVIFQTTIGCVIITIISVFVLKRIINHIFIPKKELYSRLSQDVAYIYLNFEKYRKLL